MTITLSAILPLLIAFSGLSFGALFIFIGWCLWFLGRDLSRNGITVTATVLEKFQKEDQRLPGRLAYRYVRYAFQDTSGRPHEVAISMQSKQWDQMSEGTITQLTYLPDDPDETQPGSRLRWQVRGVIGIILMACGVLSIGLTFVGSFLEFLRVTQLAN